jgi:hypothetical protein
MFSVQDMLHISVCILIIFVCPYIFFKSCAESTASLVCVCSGQCLHFNLYKLALLNLFPYCGYGRKWIFIVLVV